MTTIVARHKGKETTKTGRKKTPTFVLTLPLHAEPFQAKQLDIRFEIARKIYNACIKELYRRYHLLCQSKEYQQIMKQIRATYREEEKRRHLNQKNGTNQAVSLEHVRRPLWKEKQALQEKYGLNEYSLHAFVQLMAAHFKRHMDALTVQMIAMEKLLYGNGKKMHYKKFGQMNTVQGKWNRSGIRYRDGAIHWNGLTLPVLVKKQDTYAQMALCSRVKYCRLKRIVIRGAVRYRVQLVLEGIPPRTLNREGQFKHTIGQGKTGCDIGTQTAAIVSETCVILHLLAPRVQPFEAEIRRIQRRMDRSRRAMNPDKFELDKTVKKGVQTPWIRSKRYMKDLFLLQDICRKQAAIRRQDHNRLANEWLAQGNEFYVETMHYKALQQRVKKTTINEKTGKINRKKRFGKSIAHRAPALFLLIVRRKLAYHGMELQEIATAKVKASQYNHVTGTYEKKDLHQRWNVIDGKRIQRDLYSAFLIKHVKPNLEEIDQEACHKGFEGFQMLHDQEMKRLWHKKKEYPCSIGV